MDWFEQVEAEGEHPGTVSVVDKMAVQLGLEDRSEEARWTGLRGRIRRWVHHPVFELGTCIALLGYAALLCVSAGLTEQEQLENRQAWWWAETIFVLVFTLEVALRIVAEGRMYFANTLNLLDFVLVLAGFVELVLTWVKISAIRVLRVVRIIRVIRTFRMMEILHELRMLAVGLASAFRALFWVLFFMMLLQVVCAVLLVDGLREHWDTEMHTGDHPSGNPYVVGDFFGTVGQALFTLFQIVTLESWCMVVVRPVVHHAPWTLLVFIPNLIVSTVAVLNVVTAVFVDQILAASKKDGEYMLKRRRSRLHSELAQLKEMFMSADADGSGALTFEEFKALMHRNDVRVFLMKMDLDVHEAVALFHAVDQDGSGSADVNEFLFGVMRIRHGVKATDMISLMYDVHRLGTMVHEVQEAVFELVPGPGRQPRNGWKRVLPGVLFQRHLGMHQAVEAGSPPQPTVWPSASV